MTTVSVRGTVCVLQYHCESNESVFLEAQLADCRFERVVYREQEARNVTIYCPQDLCIVKPSWKEDFKSIMEKTVQQVVFSTIEIEIFNLTSCFRYDVVPWGLAFRERVENGMKPGMGQDSIIVGADVVAEMAMEDPYVIVHRVTVEYKQGGEGGLRRMGFTGKVVLTPFRKCANVPLSLSRADLLVFFKAIQHAVVSAVLETKTRVEDFGGIVHEYMYLCSVDTPEFDDKCVEENVLGLREMGVLDWVPIPGVVGRSVMMPRSILVYYGTSLEDAQLAWVKESRVLNHVRDQEAYWPEILWEGHPTWQQDFLATAMEYTENLVFASVLVELVLQDAREVLTYEFASTGLFFTERRAAQEEELTPHYLSHMGSADEGVDPTGTWFLEMCTIPVPGFQLNYGPRESDAYKRVFFEDHIIRPCSRTQVPVKLDFREVARFVGGLAELSLNVAHETQIVVKDHRGSVSILSLFCSVRSKVLSGVVG